MSAPVTTATTALTAGTDRPGTVPAARSGDVDAPGSRGTAPGPTGRRTPPLTSAAVVLVSVLLSVAASTSVVAFTDLGAAPAPAPAAVAEQGRDDAAPDAVEDGARAALENYGYTREGAFCPTSSTPPAAC